MWKSSKPAKPEIEYTVNLSDYRNQQVDLEIGGNRIIGWVPKGRKEPEDILVTFRGTENLLYLEKGPYSNTGNTTITFEGNRGLVYLSQNVHKYCFSAVIEENGICWFGRDVFMHKRVSGRLKIHVHHDHAVALGYDCLLSTKIHIDTAAEGSHTAGDILIGNHVWIGQDVMIEGPSTVESNAILGAGLQVRAQHLSSHAIWIMKDGRPQVARENVVFGKDSIRNRMKEELKLYRVIHRLYLGEMLALDGWDASGLIADARRAADMEERLQVFLQEAETRDYVRPKFRRTYIEPLNIPDYGENIIYGDYENADEETVIEFLGKGNVLILEKGVKLRDCHITFSGSGALVFISKSWKPIRAIINAGSETNVYLGRNCSFGKRPLAALQATENQTLFIGNNCKIGSNVWFRTSDQHPIFDVESRRRVNKARSIFIGDGERFEPGDLVTKGKQIGEMRGLLRRSYLYKQAFKAIRKASDMDERIQWMLKVNGSDALSRVERRLGIGPSGLERRTIVTDEDQQETT